VLQIDSRFLSSLQTPILRNRSFSLDISMLQKAQPLCTLKDIRYLKAAKCFKVVWFLCCSSSFRATFCRFGYDMGPWSRLEAEDQIHTPKCPSIQICSPNTHTSHCKRSHSTAPSLSCICPQQHSPNPKVPEL
jgi:hypothetical protein